MHKMGFGAKWIELVIMCVRTISFSALINGESKGTMIPTGY